MNDERPTKRKFNLNYLGPILIGALVIAILLAIIIYGVINGN